jgi:hypothetical protein
VRVLIGEDVTRQRLETIRVGSFEKVEEAPFKA